MHKTIDKLLESGYQFTGLDEHGHKKIRVDSGINAPKILIFLGNPENCDVKEIVKNGREFIKKHCPDLINETDKEFEELMNEIE